MYNLTFPALRALFLSRSFAPSQAGAAPSWTPGRLPRHIHLPPGATLRIDDGEGSVVRVRTGQVWITEEGSFVDLVIGTGEACPLTRPGRALIQVQCRTRLALEVCADMPPRGVAVALSREPGWIDLYRHRASSLRARCRREWTALLAAVASHVAARECATGRVAALLKGC
jgi:hypothetical protein